MNQELFDRVTGYEPTEFGELTPANVARLVAICAIRPSDREAVALGEEVARVLSESATHQHEFHAGRLREHEREIRAVCDRLDPKFKETGGRGAWFGFANCVSYPGTYEEGKTAATWGPAAHAGYLIALGIAVGKIKWLAPREQWSELPAGLPYFVVLAEPGENVPPPVPLDDPIKTQNPLVPWVFDMGSRILGGAKRLVKPNIKRRGE